MNIKQFLPNNRYVSMAIIFVVIYFLCSGVRTLLSQNNSQEQFEDSVSEGEQGGQGQEQLDVPDVPDVPQFPQGEPDPVVGTIMDGPGFSNAEWDKIAESPEDIYSKVPSNYYFLDDGANGALSAQHFMCSPSCCSDQYPTSFKQKEDPFVCANKDKFVKSSMMCNNTYQDSGCICTTKEFAKAQYNRFGNGREWF